MKTIIDEVYSCTHCSSPQFEPFKAAGRPYRFPPVIGATGPAPLLFIGINPRVSDSNRALHNTIMRDPAAFRELAQNSFQNQPYIGPLCPERHYRVHATIARHVFPDKTFEAVAAVTELFLCASSSSVGLPFVNSPCAEKYLKRVLAMVQPKVVFAVGQPPAKYLLKHAHSHNGHTFISWGDSNRSLLIAIPHPNLHGERNSKWLAAGEAARSFILVGKPSQEIIRACSVALPASERPVKTVSKISYRSTRLHFKRNIIEPLRMQDEFEIVTPTGTWRMTKSDFYRVFPNVLASTSYSGPRGEYHYPNPPPQARQFQVS